MVSNIARVKCDDCGYEVEFASGPEIFRQLEDMGWNWNRNNDHVYCVTCHYYQRKSEPNSHSIEMDYGRKTDAV
jgi:Zn ribbon nucleic-acid-binding protein